MSMFGTVNLDTRSLWLNYELALFVYEPQFGEALPALQQSYIEQSARLDPAVWATRAFKERFVENALRPVSPLPLAAKYLYSFLRLRGKVRMGAGWGWGKV